MLVVVHSFESLECPAPPFGQLANAESLGEALGMDLQLEVAEHAVGGYALDLIGQDTATGEIVIVENQLETSDHGHLGQLMRCERATVELPGKPRSRWRGCDYALTVGIRSCQPTPGQPSC